jgi:hypothetical protein
VQRALLYTEKKFQPQNRKSKKMKYGDYFGRKLFSPHCGNLFLEIIKKPHMHLDIPKKNCSPKTRLKWRSGLSNASVDDLCILKGYFD